MAEKTLLALGLGQKCPRCGIGDLYNPGLSVQVRDQCDQCGMHIGRHDSADGPAVFLIFLLGTILVPLALLVESLFAPPLWVHGVAWTVIALGITLGLLRPIKAYVIALQYKHRSSDWD